MVLKKQPQDVPTSWNYGSFNPTSNYFSHANLHCFYDENEEKQKEFDRSPVIQKELKYSDPEFLKAFNSCQENERHRSKERLEDPVRVSRDGSQSVTRVIDVLKKIKSPKQIKVPKETEYLIDKVIRRKLYPVQSEKSLGKNTFSK